MSERKRWSILIASALLVAIGLGYLIYAQHETIDRKRDEISALKGKIDKARKLIKTTPDLVKEVIIQRETDEVVKRILSDEEDVNNFVRTLQEFEQDSGIQISSIKEQRARQNNRVKEEFKRVGYTLTFEATAFHLLAFLDRVESYSRFMSVTAFKLSSARRMDDPTVEPRHKVQLDVETYVYAPNTGVDSVRIDQYERKRDLLISEISRRANDLQVPSFKYHGARGRRDPFVDPRVPANASGGDVISVEEQIATVDRLLEEAAKAEQLFEQAKLAENLIGEMRARAELEQVLAALEEEIRRVESTAMLSFMPAQRRFQHGVVGVVERIRNNADDRAGVVKGPSVAALKEAADSMYRHITGGESELALEAFNAIEPRLELAERDGSKSELVARLRDLQGMATTVIEFEKIRLEIQGVALYEGRRPVALINGMAVSEGEILDDELFVRAIRRDQIEFAYRGFVLARRVGD